MIVFPVNHAILIVFLLKTTVNQISSTCIVVSRYEMFTGTYPNTSPSASDQLAQRNSLWRLAGNHFDSAAYAECELRAETVHAVALPVVLVPAANLYPRL